MTREEYQAAVQMCALSGGALLQHDLPGILKAIDRAETVGPLVDPTLYREKAQDMQDDKELVKAALPLWNKMREIKERVESRKA